MKNKFKSKLKLFLFSKKSLLVSLFLVLTIAFSFAGVSNFLSLADSVQGVVTQDKVEKTVKSKTTKTFAQKPESDESHIIVNTPLTKASLNDNSVGAIVDTDSVGAVGFEGNIGTSFTSSSSDTRIMAKIVSNTLYVWASSDFVGAGLVGFDIDNNNGSTGKAVASSTTLTTLTISGNQGKYATFSLSDGNAYKLAGQINVRPKKSTSANTGWLGTGTFNNYYVVKFPLTSTTYQTTNGYYNGSKLIIPTPSSSQIHLDPGYKGRWTLPNTGTVDYGTSYQLTGLPQTTATHGQRGYNYNIAYNANGGSGSMSNSSHVFGTPSNLNANKFTRTGYTFIGWAPSSTGSVTWGSATTVGSINGGGITAPTADGQTRTIYAKWQINSSNLYVNPNGGTWKGPDNNNHTAQTGWAGDYNSTRTINNPTRTGYTFGGWTQSGTNGSLSGTTYKYGSGTSAVTLTAKWTINKYYLDVNGTLDGKSSGNISGYGTCDVYIGSNLVANDVTDFYKQYDYGSTYTIKDIKATTGHTYNGNASYTGTIGAGNVGVSLPFITNTYSVKYNGNGSTSGSMSNSSHTYGVAKNLTANAFSRTGYTFAGWATSASGNVVYSNSQSVTSLTATNGATVNLYAKWTPITYTVAYNGNSNTGGSTASSTHTYDTAKNLTANGFTKTGYSFAGWATSASGAVVYSDKKSVSNLTTTNGGTVTLYAKWTPNTYTVVYNGNGNTGGSTADSSHTYDTAKNLTSNGFSRTGYTFNGWNTAANGSGTSYANSASVNNLATSGTFNLYAQWTPNTYTVVYNGNGNTDGSTANSTHTYDVEKALTANGYTKTGYAFVGWSTVADGTGTSYGDKTLVKNLTDINGETITLYAKWTPVGNVEVVNNICDNDGVIYTSESDVFKKNSELTCTYNIWYSADGSEYSEYMINGSSSFTLKAGESKLFSNLVVGYYKIIEANNKCVAATSYNTDEIITIGTESSNSQSKDNTNEAIIQIKEITTGETNLRQYKVDFKNYLVENKIVLKYYPRLMQQGKPADMSPVASSISKTFVGMECNPDVPALIINAALDFDYDSANMIEDYVVFTSQNAAEKTMCDTFNYHTNSNYGKGVSLHTNQYGYTQTGSDEWNDNEKWVNYKQVTYSIDSDGKLVKSDAENYDYESSDKSVVPSEIKVWIFNKPKVYTVRYHSPNTIEDLNEKTVSFNGESVKVYVADTNSQTNAVSAYYNQKNGPWTSSQGTNEQTEHLKNYGIPAYNGAIIDIPQTFTAGTTNLEFKYWAFDAEGKQFASNDPRYCYRILNDIELYPVYVSNDEENASTKGLSITELQTEKYVNDNGVEKICLNQTMNPYNCDDYDANISDASVVYVMLNRNNLDAIDMQLLRDGIKEVLSENDTADKFSGKKIKIIDVTLTVNGFIYDVTYYGGSDSDSQIELTNKNRLQFSTTFNASAFSKGNTRMLCFAGMKYSGEWIVSDNYVDYNFLI